MLHAQHYQGPDQKSIDETIYRPASTEADTGAPTCWRILERDVTEPR